MPDGRRQSEPLSREEADDLYVWQRVYDADRRADGIGAASILERLLRVENRADRNFRIALTAFVGPIVTGVVVWWFVSRSSP